MVDFGPTFCYVAAKMYPSWTPVARAKAHREYRKIHAPRLNEKIRARYHARNAFVLWLKVLPCMDCGKFFPPVCMDFDHRPGTEKKFNISGGACLRRAEAFQDEIMKCDLVCANCHRIRTQNRLN